jgi:hypothetical protein
MGDYLPHRWRSDDPDETEGRRLERVRAEQQVRMDNARALHPVRYPSTTEKDDGHGRG